MNSHLHRFHDWATLARAARYRAKDLARLCQVSPRQLERYFHEEFCSTPQQWLDELRLERAAARIREGKHVKEVAYEFGYFDPSHFIRRFKRLYHCTPLKYSLGGIQRG
jgi:AraC-like DNA-binding protein